MSTNQVDLLKLFQKIKWAENGGVASFSETNYGVGWSFLGDDTPTVEDFNAIQQWNDKKDQWLFGQIATICQAENITVSEQDLEALNKAIKQMIQSAIAALVGSAPATLDTLAEIAASLGSDGNLKNTLLTEIGKKANQTDFTTFKNLLIGIPFPYPLAAVPSGCLAFNGQAFNKATYPILAQKYPSGVLPDLRGEFIRGWDNGRGVDAGRGLLSFQKNAILQHFHGQKTSGGNFVVWGEHIPVGTTIFEVSDYLKGNTSDNNRMYIPTNTDSAGKAVWDGSRFTFSALTTEGVSMTENAWDWNDNIQNETRPRNIAFQYICLAA